MCLRSRPQGRQLVSIAQGDEIGTLCSAITTSRLVSLSHLLICTLCFLHSFFPHFLHPLPSHISSLSPLFHSRYSSPCFLSSPLLSSRHCGVRVNIQCPLIGLATPCWRALPYCRHSACWVMIIKLKYPGTYQCITLLSTPQTHSLL